MRKFIGLWILMLCVLSVQAQWKITPEAGINVTKYKSYGAKMGYKAGAAVSYQFDSNWFLQSGLYFVQRGQPSSRYYEIYGTVEGPDGKRNHASVFLFPDEKYPIPGGYVQNGDVHGGYGNGGYGEGGYGNAGNGSGTVFKNMDVDGVITCSGSERKGYFQLPVMVGYRWLFQREVQLSVNAGPYMAIGVAGNYSYEEKDFSFKGRLPKNWSHSGNPFVEDGKELPNGGFYQACRRFDWGLTANVSLAVSRYVLGVGYDLGLGAERSYSSVGFNYHTLSLTVGYSF